jgi:DNA-binding GntR family transcriptional regulator
MLFPDTSKIQSGVPEGIDNAGYLAFVDALLDGRLKLGQTLRQEELCAVLGMSLSPMREATTLLEAEGLITVRKRLGISIFYPDVKFVGNTFQFRGILEREGLIKFAKAVDGAWIRQSRESHARIMDVVASARNPADYRDPMRVLERDFHGSFIAAFDNQQINLSYAKLMQKMFLIRLINMEAVSPTNSIQSMQEHIAIIDALEQRDAETAAEALDGHLRGVLHRVLTA